MFVLLISRGFPTKEYPQWGCFEKDQAEALAAYGHKVVVMSVDARLKRHKGSLGLHHFECNGVVYYNYVVLPGILFSKITGVDFYRRKIQFNYSDKVYKKIVEEHGKPDVIYSQFFWNTMNGVQLKKKYVIPLVGIEHLARFNDDKLSKETETGASFAYAGVDALIAVSNSLAKSLKRWFGNECIVVHNMYGKEFAYYDEEDIVRKRKDHLVFVSTASLVYRKGYDILIEGFKRSGLQKESWALNIIGGGDEKEKLVKLVHQCGLQDNIHFLGEKKKEDIVKELRKSDVFVLASRLETFGIVFIEAMSQGLPVIGTICGGPEEIINEKNGILIPANDVDAMANAIKEMASNYSQYDRKLIAENCREKYSPQAIAGKLTEIFKSVIRNS